MKCCGDQDKYFLRDNLEKCFKRNTLHIGTYNGQNRKIEKKKNFYIHQQIQKTKSNTYAKKLHKLSHISETI